MQKITIGLIVAAIFVFRSPASNGYLGPGFFGGLGFFMIGALVLAKVLPSSLVRHAIRAVLGFGVLALVVHVVNGSPFVLIALIDLCFVALGAVLLLLLEQLRPALSDNSLPLLLAPVRSRFPMYARAGMISGVMLVIALVSFFLVSSAVQAFPSALTFILLSPLLAAVLLGIPGGVGALCLPVCFVVDVLVTRATGGRDERVGFVWGRRAAIAFLCIVIFWFSPQAQLLLIKLLPV